MKSAIAASLALLLMGAALHKSQSRAANSAAPALTSQECGLDVRPSDLPNGDYGGFYTWPEMVSEIGGWLRNYPSLIQVSRLGTTVQGRAIPLLKISDHPERDEDEPEVLFLVGVHPREQAPTIAIMRFASELLAKYRTDPEIARLVDTREIWIVPMLNVDGKIHDFQAGNGSTRGGDWRKNRRANPDDTLGVDLNRNFPLRWGGARDFDPAWQTTTANSRGNIYEGAAPASEPETRAAMEFIASRPLRVMLDLHSPLHDMRAPAFLSASEQPIYLDLLQKMRASQKAPYDLQIGKPGAEPQSETRGGNSGVSFPWSYYTTGAYSFNIEMGFQSEPNGPYSSGVRARYAEPAGAEREYLDNVRGPLFSLLRASGDLKLRTSGRAKLTGSKWEGTPKPGARVVWKPQIAGEHDYAVALSGSAAGVLPLEFRLQPAQNGFPIDIAPDAKAGTRIPLSLYVWQGRARSVLATEIVVR